MCYVTYDICDTWYLWQTDLWHTKRDMWHFFQTDLWQTKSVTHDMWHLWQTDLWHRKIVTCYICDTQKMWRVIFVTDRFVLHKKHDMWHIGGTDEQIYINSEAYKYNVLIAAIQEHFLYVFPSAYLFMNKPSK